VPGCGDIPSWPRCRRSCLSLHIREKIVFVSGIGCLPASRTKMNTYGFYGIHDARRRWPRASRPPTRS
jgi:hypothetical protein